MKRIALLLAAIAAASQLPAVTFTYNDHYVDSRVGPGALVTDYTSDGTVVPYSEQIEAVSGQYFSSTQISQSGSGDQVTLSYDFSHQRAGLDHSYADSWGTMLFSVETDVSYQLSGFYATDSLYETPNRTYLYGELWDLTAGMSIMTSVQESLRTSDESFTLGGLAGDDSSYFTGSLTGALVAGHSYIIYYSAYTHLRGPDSDGGVTGDGNFTLKLGGGAPTTAQVPDRGASMALLGLGLVALGALRRKLAA